MPYTRVWSKAVPLGSSAAADIDQAIRDLREDIEERMATVVTGWTTASPTDPVALHDAPGVANTTGDARVLSVTSNVVIWANNALVATFVGAGDLELVAGIKVPGNLNLGGMVNATTPVNVIKRLPVYDSTGAFIGYIPVYDDIT